MGRYVLFFTALLFSNSAVFAQDFKSILLGKKLTYTDAACAGLSFESNGKFANMYGEAGGIECNPALKLRVKWLSNDMFILIEKDQEVESAPPRTFLYKINSIGKTANLTEIWTGWNDHKDERQQYTIGKVDTK